MVKVVESLISSGIEDHTFGPINLKEHFPAAKSHPTAKSQLTAKSHPYNHYFFIRCLKLKSRGVYQT